MPALLPIILAGSYLWLAAEQVPQFNTDSNCRAAATAATALNQNSCKRDERNARGKLEQEWGQFTPAQQAHCASLAKLGGPPSYVELLTCLEMATAADNLPNEDRLSGRVGK